MKLAAAIAILMLAGVAHAETKVLVLKAEGRADKTVRAKVEAGVLKLAKTNGEPTPGDITYGDAAAMVGCKPDEDKCKDEVINMLSVDEIITITTTPKPGGIEVSVRRITKGGVTKSAATMVTVDKADQLDSIAPLFFKDAPPSPLPPPVATTPATREPPPPMLPPTETTPPTTTQPTVPPPAQVAEQTPIATTPPVEERRDTYGEDRPQGRRRLTMFGMAAGGTMVIAGLIFWAAASGVEDEIADAPNRTRDDLEHIQDLEAKGDGYATAGNVLFVSGAILGGVSTYFFIKSGKGSSTRSATIVPTNGGMAITWGGSL